MNSEQELIPEIGHEARKPFIRATDTANLVLAGLRGEVPEHLRGELESLKGDLGKALAVTDALLTFVIDIEDAMPTGEAAKILKAHLETLLARLRAL